jgi:hypothetical protein
MDRFFSAVRDGKRGEVFFDTDQGWEIEVCAEEDDFFIRSRDPDGEETHCNVRFRRHLLLDLIPTIRERTQHIIGQLSNALGDDVWTNYVTNAKFVGDTSSITSESRP